MTTVARRFLAVGEAQPYGAISAVDWKRLPALVKRYPPAGAHPLPRELGGLLRASYGFNRLQWDNWHTLPGQAGLAELSRGRALRPVPSGGGLFPAELYVVGAVPGLSPGAYHFDPAADRLDRVRAGAALPGAAWHVVITAALVRTVFKYGDFGYRLACLDAGALAGQVLEVLAGAGFAAGLAPDVDDPAIEALLGLDPDAEPVVAVVAVRPSTVDVRETADEPARPTARTAPRPVAAHAPLATALARDSRAGSAGAPAPPAIPAGDPVPLPPVADGDLSGYAPARRSLDGRFGTAPIGLAPLAAVLRAGGRHPDAASTLLACVVHRVHGLAPGRYVYDPEAHAVRASDLRDLRSASAPAPGQAPLVGDFGGGAALFLLGDYEAGFAVAGSRWYRTLNVAAGIGAFRMSLAATAVGLGNRIVCAYDTARAVATLGLDGGPLRPLCQVIVGPVAGTVAYSQPLEVP